MMKAFVLFVIALSMLLLVEAEDENGPVVATQVGSSGVGSGNFSPPGVRAGNTNVQPGGVSTPSKGTGSGNSSVLATCLGGEELAKANYENCVQGDGKCTAGQYCCTGKCQQQQMDSKGSYCNCKQSPKGGLCKGGKDCSRTSCPRSSYPNPQLYEHCIKQKCTCY